MNRNRLLYPLRALAVLVLAALACAPNNTGVTVEDGDGASGSAPPKVEVYQVGDIIQVEDHTVVLNSAEFQDNVLRANFTIENLGDRDEVVFAIFRFEARDSEGTKLELNVFDCGPGLDGKVLPGDKVKGDICWSGATTDIAKIYYMANLFGSGAIVWEVQR